MFSGYGADMIRVVGDASSELTVGSLRGGRQAPAARRAREQTREWSESGRFAYFEE